MNKLRQEALKNVVEAYTLYVGSYGVPLTEDNIDLITALTYGEAEMTIDYLDNEFDIGLHEAAETGFCEWVEGSQGHFLSSCGHTWYPEYPDNLTYCPYCGKQILD